MGYTQERSNSKTVELVRLYGGAVGEPHVWGEFVKDNGRKVTVRVNPTLAGILRAAAFVGTGGRNIA